MDDKSTVLIEERFIIVCLGNLEKAPEEKTYAARVQIQCK